MLTDEDIIAFFPNVRRIAQTHFPAHAEDAASCAMLRILEYRSSYNRKRGKPGSWMSSVAFRGMLNFVNEENRHLCDQLDDEWDDMIAGSAEDRELLNEIVRTKDGAYVLSHVLAGTTSGSERVSIARKHLREKFA